jgi:RHS repeat-associated protein
LLYRGYYYDFETGLYYLQSRYYDPTVGRFINADTQLNVAVGVLGYNLFAYCNNNPVKFADTDGHFPFFAITAAIGAVTGAIVGGVKAAKAGKSVLKGALKGAAVGGLIGLGAGAAAGALLAGSVTASVTSVVIGAKAVASVVGGAGIVAGAKMLLDNASQACSSASQVFWSGGDVAKEAAKQVANDIGGKTLEMTRLGTYLEQTDASYSVWQAASENFANVASNSSEAIYSIQNVTGVSLQSTWATIEYPLLQGKDIIYGVASQGGSIQIMQ